MQKISTCLWFEKQAEAAGFYMSVFGDSRILDVSRFVEGGLRLGAVLNPAYLCANPCNGADLVAQALETWQRISPGPDLQILQSDPIYLT
ncbi:VOC family protein [Pseudarthrobacter sp. AL07]|uniref:VOC family protein n=1 Tax=unclassified Pseudarthrobacter TaxID=2647000 RepID=UPI002499B886|nr:MULTISPECIES: VOC family protein [unclassified Pseudarthrobacter]MDI3195556.1 VOC family protein [Pseudarthrobacter sp. AL20]MDI3209702.1 VOC family protein [Pseudarthrobacter sp. AL07]